MRPVSACDPAEPILRDLRSRRCRGAGLRDMADVIRRILQRKVDAFDDELIRAGFTIGEIEALRDRAMQEVARPVPSTVPRLREDTILDMAAVISLAAEEGVDGTVTRADLHRAGFTDAEIDARRAAAVAEAQRRLARLVETAA